MTGVDLIRATIARRTAQGLGLRMWGAEGRTEAEPFTCYALDGAQRDRWEASAKARGFTVERIA